MNYKRLYRTYPDGLWPQTPRRIKRAFTWMPFTTPAAPPPPHVATVMMLDLTRLWHTSLRGRPKGADALR